MLWPFVDRRERCGKPAGRSRRPAGHDGSGLGGAAAERLEPRRMLAADITLVGGVLTVAFDDAADDAVSLSITPTGFAATGANVTSGSGTISQLVVTDAGTAKPSTFTLLQADQTLTGGLSIAANVTAASIDASVTTDGGSILLAAPTTLAAITLASGSGDQSLSGGITLAGDAAITATGGGNLAVSGGVTTAAGQTAGLSINAGTAGAVTFSGVASTIAGNVSVTARNVVITADLVSTGGDILLVGDAGSTVAGAFHGVHVNGSGVEVKTLATNLVGEATGRITVFGRGGDAVAAGSSGSFAYGVYVQNGAAIAAGGSGRVDVVGTGGVSNARARSGGVFISNSIASDGVSEIRSTDGGIFVTGTAGGAPGSGENAGVQVNNFGRIAAAGSGNVRVAGTGTSTGGGGSSGVVVVNNDASQAAPTAAITSAGSSVVISGSGADGAAAVAVLNEGKVSSGGGFAVTIFADSLTLGTDSGIGAGTITAGAAGDSTLQIVPLTPGTRIDLGGEDVRTGPTRTLGLSVAEIGRLNATDLFVGDQTLAGPVIVSQPLAATSVAALTILTDAGVTLAADVTTTAGQYYAADVTLDRDVRLASATRTLDLTEIGDYATTGLARGVATSADGGIVYVADASSGLVILDVSDPAAPTLLGSVATPGSATDLALSADGTTAYVTTGGSGLQVVDVTDPQNPTLRGSVATGTAANVATVPGGRYVAVTSSAGGLFLVDVLDPAAPAVAGSSIGTLQGSAGVAVSADGSRAYLCDFADGLVVMDISDPAAPVPTGSLSLGIAGVAADVAVSPFGNLVYVTDSRGRLWIVDVTDPATPAAINTFAPAGAGGYLGLEVSADGETVFVATFENGGVGANGLVAVNVSDPTAPAILDTLSLAAPAFTLALAPGGGVAYVADGSGGLRVVDCFSETPGNGRVTFTGTVDGPVSGPGGLTVATANTIDFQAALGGVYPLTSLTTSGTTTLAADVTVAGPTAFGGDLLLAGDVAMTAGGRFIDPTSLTVAGSTMDAGRAEAVALSRDGRYGFVAAGSDGLRIVDLADPANPTITGSLATAGDAQGVTLTPDGRYALVAAGSADLLIIDVSDVSAPTLAASVAFPGSAVGIKVAVSADGTTAYVASGSPNLVVVDISVPTAPQLAAMVPFSGTSTGVAVAPTGRSIYLASQAAGLLVIDTDGGFPVVVGTADTPGSATEVAISPDGSLAYVADGATLEVIDVSDPTSPVIIGSVATPGQALGVTVSADGSYVFVADDLAGLQLVDVRDPTRPTIAGSLAMSGRTSSVAVTADDAYALLADLGAGVTVASIGSTTLEAAVIFDGPVVGPGALAVTAAAIDVANGLGRSSNRLASLTLTGDTTLSGDVYTAGDQTYDGFAFGGDATLTAGGTLSVVEGTLTGSGTAGNLVFDQATTLSVGVRGLTPVTGYGQFTVNPLGTVDLGSAAVTVSAGVPVPVGTILTIIDNQGSAPVSGTFAGLPEGATVVGSGGIFKVSYVGGDGNDVTLEAVEDDIVVSVVDNRVVITLAPTGTTVTNLSTRYVPRTGRLVITVAADSTLAGGGTGVTVNDAAGTVTVRLRELPGFTGFDVVGSAATDRITVGPGGINLAAVTRGAASQSVSIDTGAGASDTIAITRPVRMKGAGPLALSTAATDPDAGIRLGTRVSTPRGLQSYSGPITLVGPTTLAGRGMAFAGTVDGARRLTVNSTGQVVFLEDVGLTTPLAGLTVPRATGVAVLGGFRLDGTGLGRRANGLVIGRNVNDVTFAALASSAIAPTVVPRSITGFGGSGILFQGGSTGSTIRDVALVGNGLGMTFQPGNYAGTAVQANRISESTRIGISLTGGRGLTLGGDDPQDGNEIGSGSVWRAYATGIYAAGNLTGTRVSGNTISLNAGNGIVMRNARGLSIGGPANTITGNGGWGLIASGVSTGSVVAANTISGNAAGEVNVRRARGLRVVD